MNTDNFLRMALRLDAVASGTIAVGALVLSSRLDGWFGTPVAFTVGVGVFLVAFATGLWLLASRPVLNPVAVWVVILGNLAWVAASVAFVLVGAVPLTTIGTVFVLLQAAAVAVFADLEYLGIRRARPQTA